MACDTSAVTGNDTTNNDSSSTLNTYMPGSQLDESTPLVTSQQQCYRANRRNSNANTMPSATATATADCLSAIEDEFEIHDIGPLVDIGDHETTFSLSKLLRFAGPGFA
ncbi:hypothetical protein EV177_010609, partial [Coemansia sp. RSA 1804]